MPSVCHPLVVSSIRCKRLNKQFFLGHVDVMELATAASGPGNPSCGIHCGRQRRAAKAAHPVPRLELEVVQTPTPAEAVGHG